MTATTAPNEQPLLPPKKTQYFPLGYKEAAWQWWTSVAAPIAEHKVLSFVPHIREAPEQALEQIESPNPDPYGNRIWRTSMVQLSGKNRGLHEYSVERLGEEVDETLVMVHGYGAGLAYFYKTYEPLSRMKGWRLYSLDMLGMGNSTRPPFKIHAKDQQGKITEAENWFIDALEEWRIQRKIDKFTFMGHSLGGYLAVAYALKYPGHLRKLILASPAGVPEDPNAVNAAMPEPGESTLHNEFTQDQESIVSDSASFVSAKSQSVAVSNGTDAPKKPLPAWLVWLWDANFSPFSIVRMAGPFGPRFVSGWSSRRFSHFPPNEAAALHSYSFSIFRQRGSGEYALPYILAPGAFARRPIINRIQGVGRQILKQPTKDGEPPLRETGIPIVMMYGESDWMDVAGGFAAEEKLKKAKLNALLRGTDYEKRNEAGSAKVVIIPNAGHNLHLDNADEFNRVITAEMEETMAEGLRNRT